MGGNRLELITKNHVLDILYELKRGLLKRAIP